MSDIRDEAYSEAMDEIARLKKEIERLKKEIENLHQEKPTST
jgi:archaellum component FlaC